MKVNAFLQARYSSSRLPGKVMKEISGKPMLLHQIERLKKSKEIYEIVVLTSIDAADDSIHTLCVENGINCFRGDLEDVLSRFIGGISAYPCDHVVRITGDCPLLDWDLVDFIVNKHVQSSVDYTSNTIHPTYPDGLDVEVIRTNCLLDIKDKALKSYEREHVTYYIYQNPEVYSLNNVVNPLGDESEMRWTVDEKLDFDFVNTVYKKLYKGSPFLTNEVRLLLDKSTNLSKINSGIERNMGLIKSLKESR